MAFGFGFALTAIAKAVGFSPSSLFASGAQGAWYDPSDYTTLFEDSAGTIPITSPLEKPVGLMLDKSRGLVLGGQVLLDPSFDNAANWTAGAGWGVSGGVATATSAASGVSVAIPAGARPTVSLGSTYEFIVVVDSVSAGGVAVLWTGVQGPTLSSPGTYRFFIQSGGTSGSFSIRAVGTTTAVVSSASVREIPGNHAYQSTTTSRPTLSARYNLLTKTEQFDDAVWTKTNSTVTPNVATAPNGTSTADLLIETASTGEHNTSQTITATATTSYRLECYVKRAVGVRNAYFQINNNVGGAGGAVAGIFDLENSTAITTTLVVGFSGLSASIVDAGNGWYLCTVALTTASDTTSLSSRIGVYNGDRSYTGDGTSGIYIWGADLRVANDGIGLPAYQRVNTATDYDYAGFPPYLKFDGTDDGMATGNIDFTGTDKMSVFAGVRKLSDANDAVFVETNTSILTGFGAFNIRAPNGAGAATYAFNSRGSSLATAATASSFAAPLSSVVAAIADISNDSAILRINGTQAASSTADQGTGNYGNYPLYIGRRGGTTLPFNGRLYSLIVCGKLASASEIANTEDYVEKKTFGKDMNYVYSDEVLTAASEQITTADGQNVYMTVTYQ